MYGLTVEEEVSNPDFDLQGYDKEGKLMEGPWAQHASLTQISPYTSSAAAASNVVHKAEPHQYNCTHGTREQGAFETDAQPIKGSEHPQELAKYFDAPFQMTHRALQQGEHNTSNVATDEFHPTAKLTRAKHSVRNLRSLITAVQKVVAFKERAAASHALSVASAVATEGVVSVPVIGPFKLETGCTAKAALPRRCANRQGGRTPRRPGTA